MLGAAQFLELILPDVAATGGYVEVVFSFAQGELQQSLYVRRDRIEDVDKIVAWSNECEIEVYFGPVLRRDRGEPWQPLRRTPFGAICRRSSGEDVVERASTLWLDIDPPKDADAQPWRRLKMADLQALPVPPTIIVSSGRGLHVYWKMRGTWDDYPDADLAATINQRLSYALNGDPRPSVRCGLLRLPCGMHRKGVPRPVEVVWTNTSSLGGVHAREVVEMLDLISPESSVLDAARNRSGVPTSLPAESRLCAECQARVDSFPGEEGAHAAIFVAAAALFVHGTPVVDAIKILDDRAARFPRRRSTTRRKIEAETRSVYHRIENGLAPVPFCAALQHSRIIRLQAPAGSPPRNETTLADVRSEIAAVVDEWVHGRRRKSIFVTAPPGAGKSTAIINSAARVANHENRIILVAPTVRMAESHFERARLGQGAKAALFRGRTKESGEFHCANLAAIEALSAANRSALKYCRGGCPHAPNCDWLAARDRAQVADFVISTHASVAEDAGLLDGRRLLVDEGLESLVFDDLILRLADLKSYAARLSNDRSPESEVHRALAAAFIAVIETQDPLTKNLVERLRPLEAGMTTVNRPARRWESEIPPDPRTDEILPALSRELFFAARLLLRHEDDVVIAVGTAMLTMRNVPREHILDHVLRGKVLVADATPATALLKGIGFEVRSWCLPPPKNLEIVAVAKKIYGPTRRSESAAPNGNAEVISAATAFLELEDSAVVVRKSEAEVLRKHESATGRVFHYGDMRGSNRILDAGIRRILVSRWSSNISEMRQRARAWRVVLRICRDVGIYEAEHVLQRVWTDATDQVEVPFAGLPWAREGVHRPVDPVLRALAEQDRLEILQAIGRLRADMRPNEKLLAVIMDGWPVAGVNYSRMLETQGGEPGGIAELLQFVGDLHEADGRHDVAEKVRASASAMSRDTGNVSVRRNKPLAAANAKRAADAEARARADGALLREVMLAEPDATVRHLQQKLGWGLDRFYRAKAFIE